MVEGAQFDSEYHSGENGHFDETTSLGNRVISFLKASFPPDGTVRKPKYDQVTEVSSSGGTNGFKLLFSENPEIEFVTVTKQNGDVISINARLKGSTDDFYISGKALVDFFVDGKEVKW